MLEPWRTAVVTRIEPITKNTRRFWLKIPELQKFDFIPGQFITLDLPIHEKKNKRWRSYSIASWPDETNELELVIVHLEGGLGTTYLFNEIQVGSHLLFRGPQGVFTLPESLEKDLFLICTGTGVAPFRSMVQYIKLHNIPYKNIHLIFGTRTKEDILYYKELNDLQKGMNSFHYHPVLSREKWEGPTGYVHQVYQDLCRGNTNSMFFLCGWKEMIDEAKNNLLEMGFDKKDIHFELYG